MGHHSESELPSTVEKKSLKAYVIGFALSIVLTLASYFLVVKQMLSGSMLAFSLLTLGIIQAAIQLIFFLNLGREHKPRWNILIFSFMAFVVLIVVLGTFWIMETLNYRVMDIMEMS